MKIGLIADTHIIEDDVEPPYQVAEIFQGMELILHAGDLIVWSVLDWLEKIAPVLAVSGNGDSGLLPDSRLPQTRLLTLSGKRIGMCHCLEPLGYPRGEALDDFIRRWFSGGVDAIVFGDTHVAVVESCNGVLVVNPGSPTIPRGLVGVLGTVGILEISDTKVEAHIVPFR
jgi:putative phosphoesterase